MIDTTVKHNNEVNMLLISNNDKRWVSINNSKQNKSIFNSNIQIKHCSTKFDSIATKNNDEISK